MASCSGQRQRQRHRERDRDYDHDRARDDDHGHDPDKIIIITIIIFTAVIIVVVVIIRNRVAAALPLHRLLSHPQTSSDGATAREKRFTGKQQQTQSNRGITHAPVVGHRPEAAAPRHHALHLRRRNALRSN